MLHTTLTLLRRANAGDSEYSKLLASLPANLADDAPITLIHILGSNGIKDTIWALRATVEPTGRDVARELACRAAERALLIFERRRPGNMRPREYIEAARAYGRGEITLAQLDEKRAAAADAYAYVAYADAADAYAYAADAADAAAADAYVAYADAADAYAYAADAADAAAADAYAYVAYADAADDAARKAEREAQAADMRELLSAE